MKIVGLVLLLIILLVVLWNVIQYYRLRETAQYYLERTESASVEEPLDLVGLLDSYGVPYSPSVEKSFMGYLEEDLERQGMLSSSLDLYGLYINKTWEVDGIFQNDVTIGEMKTMQNFGMDFVRHKYGKERIREDLVYTCDKEQEDVTVASYYSGLNRPVVLYSCAANDLFYYFGTSLESISLLKVVRIIRNLGNGLALLRQEIKKNMETLTAYNPKAVIMVMGLYVPSDNILLQRAGAIIVDRINGIIEDVCEEYPNAVYVDVSCLSFAVLEGDFHPSEKGQEILYRILMESLRQKLAVLRTVNTVAETDAHEALDMENHVSGAYLNLLDFIDRASSSHNDYVETAVAIEQTLRENGIEDISEEELIDLKASLPAQTSKVIYEGLEILIIERKIHRGFALAGYTSNTNLENDKLGLAYTAAN